MKMLEQVKLLPQNYYRVTISGIDTENHYVTDTIAYTDDLYLNFKTDTFAEICELIEKVNTVNGDLSQIDKDEFSYLDISEYKAIMYIGIDLYKNGVWYGVDIVDDDVVLSPEYDVTTMSIPRIIDIQKNLIETIVNDSFKSSGVEILFIPKSDSDGQSINVKKKHSPKYVKVTYDNIYTMANYDYDKYPNLDILSGINFHIFIERDAIVKALPLLNENPDYKFGLTRYGGAEYKDIRSLSVVSKYDDSNVKEEDSSETFFEEDLRSILNASGKIHSKVLSITTIPTHIYDKSNEVIDLNDCDKDGTDGMIFSICIANVSLTEDECNEADKEGGYSFHIKSLIKAKQRLKNAVIFLNQEAAYEYSLCCASSLFLPEYICGINNMRQRGQVNKDLAAESVTHIKEVLAELRKLNPADHGIVFDNSLFIIDDELNIHTI
jgi:hypothetical protein